MLTSTFSSANVYIGITNAVITISIITLYFLLHFITTNKETDDTTSKAIYINGLYVPVAGLIIGAIVLSTRDSATVLFDEYESFSSFDAGTLFLYNTLSLSTLSSLGFNTLFDSV